MDGVRHRLSQYKKLWKIISARRKNQLVIVAVLLVVVSLVEIVSIGAVVPFLAALMSPGTIFSHPGLQPFLHVLSINSESDLQLFLTLTFVVASLISCLLRFILLRVQLLCSYGIGREISYNIYLMSLAKPYEVMVSANTGDMISAITIKSSGVVSNTIFPLIVAVGSSVTLVSIVGAIMLISPYVAITVIGCFSLTYGAFLIANRSALARHSQTINYQTNITLKAVQEGLGAIREITIRGLQGYFVERYRRSDEELRYSLARVKMISVAPRYFVEAVSVSLFALLGFWMVRDGGGEHTVPILGAFAIAAQRMLPALQQIYQNISVLRGDDSTLVEILDLLAPKSNEVKCRPSPQQDIKFGSTIRFEKVSFVYEPGSGYALSDINLQLEKGSRIGIVGPTGCGKSTLANLLMGLLMPTSGAVTLDGVPITVANRQDWMKRVAHVPQSIYLADASVAENIAFGIAPAEIDYKKIEAAVRKAQLSRTIEQWADGYQTRVGERGERLSGGQRQRIGIARALYNNAEVLVIDEGTNALDRTTEIEVAETLRSLSPAVTLVWVAHNLSVLKSFDQIVMLEAGKVVANGSYDEIINSQRQQQGG